MVRTWGKIPPDLSNMVSFWSGWCGWGLGALFCCCLAPSWQIGPRWWDLGIHILTPRHWLMGCHRDLFCSPGCLTFMRSHWGKSSLHKRHSALALSFPPISKGAIGVLGAVWKEFGLGPELTNWNYIWDKTVHSTWGYSLESTVNAECGVSVGHWGLACWVFHGHTLKASGVQLPLHLEGPGQADPMGSGPAYNEICRS